MRERGPGLVLKNSYSRGKTVTDGDHFKNDYKWAVIQKNDYKIHPKVTT